MHFICTTWKVPVPTYYVIIIYSFVQLIPAVSLTRLPIPQKAIDHHSGKALSKSSNAKVGASFFSKVRDYNADSCCRIRTFV